MLSECLLPEVRADTLEAFQSARGRDGRERRDKGESVFEPATHQGGIVILTDKPHVPESHPSSSGPSNPSHLPKDGTPRNVQPNEHQQPPFQAWFPLNDKAASLFFSKVTDTAVMSLVTLATFLSTYLLAWGKPGTNCIPYFNSTDANNVKYPDPSWQQRVAGLLPFVIFPVALYLSGFGKIAETEKRALSVISTICLGEFIVAFVLGGMMSHCMAAVPLGAAFGVPALFILVTIVVWGLTFKYPKFLRSLIWSKCLRRAEVEQEVVPGAGSGADLQ